MTHDRTLQRYTPRAEAVGEAVPVGAPRAVRPEGERRAVNASVMAGNGVVAVRVVLRDEREGRWDAGVALFDEFLTPIGEGPINLSADSPDGYASENFLLLRGPRGALQAAWWDCCYGDNFDRLRAHVRTLSCPDQL